MTVKVFSFGGGVQSTAALVLAAQGRIDYRTFLFCNVGDDSENPATITYVTEIAKPYAQQHGIDLIELQKHNRAGKVQTIYGEMMRSDISMIGIPAYLPGKVPASRDCTVAFKVRVVDRWLHAQGAGVKGDHAVVGLGISMDEFQRMRDSGVEWKKNEYPLIDLRLSRQDCVNIIERAGLPIPPKSSCWFCPFHRRSQWQEMRTHEPALFKKAVELEEHINRKRMKHGRDLMWLTSALKPLSQVTTDLIQGSLLDDEDAQTCDSGGYCMA